MAAVTSVNAQTSTTPAQARVIAKEAYIYGFPMVDNYRIQYAYFVDTESPDYKAPWNTLRNLPRVYTPEDKAVQTPNSDTPYSFIGMDLRVEPIVITVPKIEQNRYFSIQLVDAYTHNFGYIGSRVTGNEGGSFLIAGPSWKGETPKGISKVIRSETELVMALYRTQLFNPGDMDNVKTIQADYQVETLSAHLGQSAQKAVAATDFMKPLSADKQKSSLEFFEILNFVLQFAPTHPSEAELMASFAKIGVGAGMNFDANKLSPEMKAAIQQGIGDAWGEFVALQKQAEAGEIGSGDVFGTREFLNNNYLYRMAGAVLGIYGNTEAEAIYPPYYTDSDGNTPDGANNYMIYFAPGQLPPVHAFWSLTMYEMPSRLLVDNPINRYLMNSPMLPQFARDTDGGLTLYIQHESPGKDKEANWLPTPKGPFSVIMRLYWPKAEALDGSWDMPELTRVQDTAKSSAVGAKVTPETYIRAETDRAFYGGAMKAGGVNRLDHNRVIASVEQQPIVRMNRDTLYSGAIVDTNGGATITVPEIPGDRYMSVLLIDNDHYVPFVIYTNTNSADPLPPFKWDIASLKSLTEQYEQDASQIDSFGGMQGPRGKVAKEKTRHIAAAAGWGLFPDQDATYLNYNGGHDHQQCYQATYQVPENKAFWSITVYGSDGYMKSDNVTVNSSGATMNADGTFTVHYGSKTLCGDMPNRLDIAEGWNYTLRVYRPALSVIDGSYTLPKVEPVR
jgi:hypothetical protein